MPCCNSVARFGSFYPIFNKYWYFRIKFGNFWIWTIWQCCGNGQIPKFHQNRKCPILELRKCQNYRISQLCQIWTWIFPKSADFGFFDQFLAKNASGSSGDAVPIGHWKRRKVWMDHRADNQMLKKLWIFIKGCVFKKMPKKKRRLNAFLREIWPNVWGRI